MIRVRDSAFAIVAMVAIVRGIEISSTGIPLRVMLVSRKSFTARHSRRRRLAILGR